MIRLRCLLLVILLLAACLAHASQTAVPESLQELARLKADTNPARLDALKTLLRNRGIPFELQSFDSPSTPHGRVRGTNLVMSFGAGSREITVGAHYDVVEAKEGGLIGGYVDNGASVIILMRLAEALKQQTLHNRVRIVLFDMEEVGSPGSKAYIAAHKSEIAAAVNVDVAGLGRTMAYALGKVDGIAPLQKAIEAACNNQQAFCIAFGNFPPSDDRSFQAAGIPAVSIAFIPPIAEVMVKAPMIMKMLHSPDDSIDKIQAESLDPAVRVLLDAVVKLDEALQ